MAITDAWLKATHGKGIGVVVTRTDRDGLSVRVSAKGKLTFQMRYSYDGKEKRLDIGSYPLMRLKQARDENERLRSMLEQGHDPKIIKITEKQVIVDSKSFNELFTLWYNTQCVHDMQKPEHVKRSFELHVLPVLGKLPADKITLQTWLKLLEKLSKDVPQIASRVLTQVKKIYKWAVKREILEHSPLVSINAKSDLKIKRPKGKRVLLDDELVLLWKALKYTTIAPQFKLLMKLCLFFGCRVAELKLAKKSDFDFKTMVWTVPAENHKMGDQTEEPLLRPIIDEIVPTLKEVFELSNSRSLAFTKIRTNAPMSDSGHIDTPTNIANWIKNKEGVKDMPHWSTHDLRRTMRTNLSAFAQPHIAEVMLGHALPAMWQVYDHHDYLSEQRAAYIEWFDRLDRIVGEF